MLTFLRSLSLIFLVSSCISCSSSVEQTNLFFANAVVDEEVMGKFARSCALCHVSGVADAPIVGDIEEWRSRLGQGEAIIIRNVLEGINSMPPLGYCMSCEVDDFRAMIGFMAGTNSQ